MNIYLNGEPHRTEPGNNLAKILESIDLKDKRVAVELNQEIIPRALFEATLVSEGDRLEIVHAIGGG